MEPMVGHRFNGNGGIIQRAGFMPDGLGESYAPGPSGMIGRGPQMSAETQALISRLQDGTLERADLGGDLGQILSQFGASLAEIQRGITSTATGFPVRENLEAEAKILVPLDTPVRNMLPRVPGSGLSSLWRQVTSLGGGYGAQNLTNDALDQPGGVSTYQSFFAESGAPDTTDFATVYVAKSKAYKLMGVFGSVTGFAMAGGANFQNQLAFEKTNAIRNLMLNEENALINGDSTSTSAPWGDGTNALAYDGILKSIATGNGTPSAQVQTSVGPLTLNHIDNQIKRLWAQGGQQVYILASAQEILSLVHLAEASGSIIRVSATANADSILGVAVTGYKHPVTGEICPIYASRFMPGGTMVFGSKFLPDGTPGADVSVLPQVQLPVLAPNEMVQGYVAQEIAPTSSAPQVYGFLVSLFSVFRMKSAIHFAKSTGITAV